MKNRTNSKLLHFIMAIIILVVGCFCFTGLDILMSRRSVVEKDCQMNFASVWSRSMPVAARIHRVLGLNILSRY